MALKDMAWVQLKTKSTTILKDMAAQLTTAVKDATTGVPDPAKNWSLVYPVTITVPARLEAAAETNMDLKFVSTDNKVFKPQAGKVPLAAEAFAVFVNGKEAPHNLQDTITLTGDAAFTVYSAQAQYAPWLAESGYSIMKNTTQVYPVADGKKSVWTTAGQTSFDLLDKPLVNGSLTVKKTNSVVGMYKARSDKPPAHYNTTAPNGYQFILANTPIREGSVQVIRNAAVVDPAMFVVDPSTGRLNLDETLKVDFAAGQTLEVNYESQVYTVDHANGKVAFVEPLVDGEAVSFEYRFGELNLDAANGKVTFLQALKATDVVKVTATFPARMYSTTKSADNKTITEVTFVYPLQGADVVTSKYTYEVPAQETTQAQALDDVNLERIVLKTVTAARNNAAPNPDDPESSVTTEDVFLEIRRPPQLKNPNTGSTTWFVPALDQWATTSEVTTHYPNGTMRLVTDAWAGYDTPANHHFIELRLMDKFDGVTAKPAVDAKVGQWSKLSWYKDWETLPLDNFLVAGKGVSHIAGTNTQGARYRVTTEQVDNFFDGLIMRPLETKLVEDKVKGNYIPVQIFMNCNNNRISLVVQGDPVADFNQYLISFGYVGQLDSFEGMHDVVGNFAITTGSSTAPNATIANPLTGKATLALSLPNEAEHKAGVNHSGHAHTHASLRMWEYSQPRQVSRTMYYQIVQADDEGQSAPSARVTVGVQESYAIRYWTGQSTYQGGWLGWVKTMEETPMIPVDAEIKVGVKLTDPRTKFLKIYRSMDTASNLALARLVPVSELTPDGQGGYYFIDKVFTDHAGYKDAYEKVPAAAMQDSDFSIRRDTKGNVVDYVFASNHGRYTGTGVLDINVMRTKSGMYWQRHQVAAISADKNLPKDENGYSLSQFTKKFHLSPIYIVHGFEGHRGFLGDVLAVDGRLLYHLDDLVVDRGTPWAKTYKFFKVNAPFSVFEANSDGQIGLAILMHSAGDKPA